MSCPQGISRPAELSGRLGIPGLADEQAVGVIARQAARAVKDGDKVRSGASANASIDGKVSYIGDVQTGGIGSMSDMMAGDGVNTMQLSTGIGNIQQGVSAVAISN